MEKKINGMTTQEIVSKVAKGDVQASFVRTILSSGSSGSWYLYMKAQSYSSNYCTSLNNALYRLHELGIKTETKLGPRGGSWKAETFLVEH